eukprot:GHVP01053070.1.p1 GENE.GHVP01053070.1~~GHVP01053070.1.p1  ORF type:complete len:559 (+),score=85.78 GHVP01053070.1:880-2556(+)
MAASSEIFAAAEAIKLKGNAELQNGNIAAALSLYTEAIDLVTESEEYCAWKSDKMLEPEEPSETLSRLIRESQKKKVIDTTTKENIKEGQTKETESPTSSLQEFPKFICPLHVYFSNRAHCHLKMENIGLAIQDGDMSVVHNPMYSKGYYRRACAYFLLQKYQQATTDFSIAWRLTGDVSAKQRALTCKELHQRFLFLEAIGTQDPLRPSETIEWNTMSVVDFTGPDISASARKIVTDEKERDELFCSVKDFLTAKTDNLIPKKHLLELLVDSIQYYKMESTVVDIPVDDGTRLTVCGDVHGQFYDLVNIFKLNGNPGPDNPYLFNGDFVDRGTFSIEVMVTFLLAKLLWPSHVHLTRGNHETYAMNSVHGFQQECQEKYDQKVYQVFTELFRLLPLAHIIRNEVFVVHGGLFSQDGVMLSDLRAINRDMETPEKGLMCDMLWSDPQPENGRSPSKRGVATAFGPDVTEKFLSENNLRLLVRSHEMKEEGYSVEHNGKCITVFSAPNYCDVMKNLGAYIIFKGVPGVPLEPVYHQFSHVPHPEIIPRSSPMLRMMNGI